MCSLYRDGYSFASLMRRDKIVVHQAFEGLLRVGYPADLVIDADEDAAKAVSCGVAWVDEDALEARNRPEPWYLAAVRLGPGAAGVAEGVGVRAVRRRSGRLGQLEAGLPQQACSGDQRQPDQRGRVVVVDPFEQGDAPSFGLEAAGAIEWLLALQVAQDLLVAQWAKMHGEGYAVDLAIAVVGVE